MVFAPSTTETVCVMLSPVESFVLHVCSQILQRMEWLREPDLRLKRIDRTSRHKNNDDKHGFVVTYSLVSDGNKTRDFQIELDLEECCDGITGNFIAKAITQKLKVKGDCFAVYNSSREVKSAHLILD